MKSKFLNYIKSRGYVQDCTNFEGIDEYFSAAENGKKPAVAYIGFDCTAETLHVGSLLQIMILRAMQKHGHKPIFLLGGGTTKVGDPSGKDESRKILTQEIIEKNKAGIKKVFEKYVTFEDKFDANSSHAYLVDNDEWLNKLNYIEFLRDVGKYFSINRMLGFESVKRRLDREQNLSFLEFNYMILQAYDFVELAKRYACRVQIGGSDQWGNIVNGTELNHKMDNKAAAIFGLTTPLLTTSSGAKMGKTADGAVWLDKDFLSEYDYWQFWRNTSDEDTVKFIKIFTDIAGDDLAKIEKMEGAELNQAKIILANAATAMCHGEAAAQKAEQTAKEVFEAGGIGGDLPVVEVSQAEIEAGLGVIEAFVRAGFGASNGEVRRLIKGGGAKMNDEKVSDENMKLSMADFVDGKVKISSGKKKHAVLKISN